MYHISHARKESYRTIAKTIKKLRSQDLKISGAKLRGTGSDIKGSTGTIPLHQQGDNQQFIQHKRQNRGSKQGARFRVSMHRGNLEIQNPPVCTDDDTFPHLPIDILDLYLLAYMLPGCMMKHIPHTLHGLKHRLIGLIHDTCGWRGCGFRHDAQPFLKISSYFKVCICL